MKFLLPSASLFPLSPTKVLQMAKKAGFDGVEIMLFGPWRREDVEMVLERGDKLGLIVHFHAPWSVSESNDGITFRDRLLTAFGLLPKDGYILENLVPANAHPLVVYSDVLEGYRDGYWVQTVSTGTKYKVPYKDFLKKFEENPFPVVFDTQHVLEYMNGKPGVGDMVWDYSDPIEPLCLSWEVFREQVKEIHFNDFDPSKGDRRGRNVFPGTGYCSLPAFARMVASSGWDGFVVPEVNPRHIRYKLENLIRLREYLDYCF